MGTGEREWTLTNYLFITLLSYKMASDGSLLSSPQTAPVPLETLPYWGRGKDEDVTRLAAGWEARVTPEGRVFFVK